MDNFVFDLVPGKIIFFLFIFSLTKKEEHIPPWHRLYKLVKKQLISHISKTNIGFGVPKKFAQHAEWPIFSSSKKSLHPTA